MKKLISMLLALVMVLSLAACGGENGAEAGTTEYKVARLTDYSDITAPSFTPTSYEGC